MKLIHCSLFVLTLACMANAQISYFETGSSNDILNRLELKGAVPVLPYNRFLSRNDFEKMYTAIDSSKLTRAELDELNWFAAKNYSFDNKASFISNNLSSGLSNYYNGKRLELFEWYDSMYTLKVRPKIRFGALNAYSETRNSSTWGWDMFGRIAGNLEYHFQFEENNLTAKKYLRELEYEPTHGRIYSGSTGGKYQYSETNGSLLYSNNYITIGLTKERMKLGGAIAGQLVLSEKAPSFPSYYLKLSPVKWLNIYSMHGWLISNVTDSTRSYPTEVHERTIEYEKYYVMHAFQVIPSADLSLTFGETIIYSDRSIYAGYFLPFLFYRSVDHQFTFGSGESGNNGSFFFEIAARPANRINTYVSLFIDEFSMGNFLKGDNNRNQLGYTLGIKSYPVTDGNLEVNAEYTKILPWVYSNWVPTQTYRNAGFVLGHWLGQNADQIYLEAIYTPALHLKFKLWGQAIRRGGLIDVKNQYTEPGEKFLYGPRMNQFSLGVFGSYEIFYNTSVNFEYLFSKITDDDNKRTPLWQKGSNHSMNFNFAYGI